MHRQVTRPWVSARAAQANQTQLVDAGAERRSSDPWVLAQTASYYDNSPAAHMLQLIVGRISIKCTPADHSFGRRRSIHTLRARILKWGWLQRRRRYICHGSPGCGPKLISSLASNLRSGSILQLRIATPVGIQEECGRAHFSDEIENWDCRVWLFGHWKGLFEKGRMFFSPQQCARSQTTLPLAYW